MADHVAGEAMGGAHGLGDFDAVEPRGAIAGIETVTGRGGIDRHHDFRHRHEFPHGAGSHQRAVRPVLDHDFADTEDPQPRHRRFRTGIAPDHRFIVESWQRDVDALERLDENGARAPQIVLPAARAEVPVERPRAISSTAEEAPASPRSRRRRSQPEGRP